MDLDKILLPYENFMALCLKKENDENFLNEFLKSFFECLDSS
jgi:thiamine monophosphate kinase